MLCRDKWLFVWVIRYDASITSFVYDAVRTNDPMLLEAKIRKINLKIKKKTYFFVYFVVVKRCMTVSYNDTFQNCILIIQLKLELLLWKYFFSS